MNFEDEGILYTWNKKSYCTTINISQSGTMHEVCVGINDLVRDGLHQIQGPIALWAKS